MGSIIHHSELHITVTNSDSCLDRVVVCCDVKPTFFDLKVPSFTLVHNTLLHFEAVRVSVEDIVVVKHGSMEVSCHFEADIFVFWDSEKLNFILEYRQILDSDRNHSITFFSRLTSESQNHRVFY